MRDGNATFEEPKVHFSYIYMWEMHFLGQKNVSDFTKRSFFVYIYILEMHFGVVNKNLLFHKKFTFRIYICWKRISKNVTKMSHYHKFSLFVYIYVRNAFFDRKDVSLDTKSSLFVYIYAANAFFGSQNVEKVMQRLIWSGIYRLGSI